MDQPRRGYLAGVCLKKLLAALVWIGYLVLGGYLFSSIERHQDQIYQNRLEEDIFNAIYKVVRNATQSQGGFGPENPIGEDVNESISLVVDGLLQQFQPEREFYKWNIHGGIHFCLTVVSTIGYGMLAPKTQLGRIVCVIYALIGIPLNIVFMAGVGRGLARVIDFTYSKWMWLFNACRATNRRSGFDPKRDSNCRSASRTPNSAWRRADQEHDDHSRGRVVGDGDDAGSKDVDGRGNPRTCRRAIFHIAYTDWATRDTTPDETHLGDSKADNVSKFPTKSATVIPSSDEVKQVECNVGSAQPEAPILYVILFVLTFFLGMSFVARYCGISTHDWTLVDVIYFHFVTFSTIGFGDLYIARDKKMQEFSFFIVDMLVLTAGMAFLSIFINMVFRSKKPVRALGYVTGVLKKIRDVL